MSLRTSKRNTTRDEGSDTNRSEAREEEKTIPFLKRLTEMLAGENQDVISFTPGSRDENGQHAINLGKIVVHDRARVEAEVLPQYFNHASFASLRRQLNYFSFARLGKGRQRGAIYQNEGVVELEDILHLKRRPAGASVTVGYSSNESTKQEDYYTDPSGQSNTTTTACTSILSSVVPVVHLPKKKRPYKASSAATEYPKKRKKAHKINDHHFSRSRVISPGSTSPSHGLSSDEEGVSQQPRLFLDLTLPAASNQESPATLESWRRGAKEPKRSWTYHDGAKIPDRDTAIQDILLGCSALLSMSSSTGDDTAF